MGVPLFLGSGHFDRRAGRQSRSLRHGPFPFLFLRRPSIHCQDPHSFSKSLLYSSSLRCRSAHSALRDSITDSNLSRFDTLISCPRPEVGSRGLYSVTEILGPSLTCHFSPGFARISTSFRIWEASSAKSPEGPPVSTAGCRETSSGASTGATDPDSMEAGGPVWRSSFSLPSAFVWESVCRRSGAPCSSDSKLGVGAT